MYSALTGPHARFAERRGRILRYPVDVSPFLALPPDPTAQDWADLVSLAGPGGLVALPGVPTPPPPDLQIVMDLDGVQMIDDGVAATPDPEAVTLTADDVPEILELVERTEPGPFLPRTIELGTYLGIRRRGALVAMAGERLHPKGWTEISAVCTDAEHRGQGLASRLIGAVAAGIGARGERPFLHAAADNPALRLYSSLGFTVRRRVRFQVAQIPVAG